MTNRIEWKPRQHPKCITGRTVEESEYLVWRREDLEGHDNCLQIFVELDIVSVAPAAMISKKMMIKANNNYIVSTYFEAATMGDAL